MSTKYPYLRKSWNLAAYNLPSDMWFGFQHIYPDFPANGSGLKKLGALRRGLSRDLGPQDIRENPDLRYEHMRADLNKYHGWLTHKILQHTLNSLKKGPIANDIILPEDLPKVIEDLYNFHKHSADIAARTKNPAAGTIQFYKSLEQLRDAVDHYRAPPSPLTLKQRNKAFSKHLKECGGDGGAEIISTLQNGTLVIQVKTEQASLAFGSPHWCTSYRNQPTYFEDYADDLLIVLEPDGRRYQVHFRTGQCNDANDQPVELSELVNANPGLDKILAPYLKKFLVRENINIDLKLLESCRDNQVFGDIVEETKYIQRATRCSTDFGKLVDICIGDERFESILALPEGIIYGLNYCADLLNFQTANHVLASCIKSEVLKAAICRPEGLANAINTLCSQTLKNYQSDPGASESGYTQISRDNYTYHREQAELSRHHREQSYLSDCRLVANFILSCKPSRECCLALLDQDGIPHALKSLKSEGYSQDLIRSVNEAAKRIAETWGIRLAGASQPAPAPRPTV